MCRSKGSEHFPQCAGRGWAVVALTATTCLGWAGTTENTTKKKNQLSLSLFRERKIESHANWAPLGLGGGRRSESTLFQALAILAKPPLLSAASAGD